MEDVVLLPPLPQAATPSRQQTANPVATELHRRRFSWMIIHSIPIETKHSSSAFGLALNPVGRRDGANMLGAVVMIVRVVLPLPVTEAGMKLQVLSAGRPAHEKVTVPVNPFVAATESIAVPVCPGLDIVIVAGLNERLKFGPVAFPDQLFTRLAASTDPSPVAKS